MVKKPALFDAPEAEPKVTKQEFAYVNDKSNPRCGACNMYIEGGKCSLVKGEIDPEYGECIFWAYRRTKPIVGKEHKPMLTQKEAFYEIIPPVGDGIHEGGSLCGICKHYLPSNADPMVGKCEMVEGEIEYHGCCIAWAPNKDAEDAIKGEENYRKILKFYGEEDTS